MDILYTNTLEIRSILLLAEEDLPDTLFSVDLYERELELNLGSWLPDYATIATTPGTEQNILLSYCAYWCARKVAATLTVSVPQQVSDGKNSLQRYPKFDELLASIESTLADLKSRLLDSQSTPITSTYPGLSVVGLAVDPVTSSGT